MTTSLHTPLMFALILVAFVLPGIVRADSTFCYPDGCVTMNTNNTRADVAAVYGYQTTLAQSLETIFQIIFNTGGHPLANVVRDAAGRVVYLACSNSVTFSSNYNDCPAGYIKKGDQCVPSTCPVGYIKQGTQCMFDNCPLGYVVNKDNQCVFSECPTGYVQQGTQCVFSECPQGYAYKNGECVNYNICTTPPHCSGNDLMNSCTGAKLQSCDWGCSAGECNPVPAPSATLKAIPSLVHSGDITIVSWTGTNVSSCIVHATNGDSWTGTSSAGKTSSPILGQTIYTLHCVGYQYAYPPTVDKSVTVNIIPTFNEK